MLTIEDFNFHWRKNFFYHFPKERNLCPILKERLKADTGFILILYGQRRTGKTTIVKQLIDHLIQSGVERQHILYYSFDKSAGMVSEVLKQYEKMFNGNFSAEKKYVFFDEIQKAKDWNPEVKYYYDNFSHLQIFLTGSSSLFIKEGEMESLAGRTLEYKLDPLGFDEYLRFNDSEDMLENISFFKEQLSLEYLNFLKKPYINLLELTDEESSKVVHTLLDKIIFQDIPQRFPVDEPELLKRLMQTVCSQPGFIIEYNSLAQELGRNRATISNYFYYLEQAFLIKKLYNYSPNLLTSEKKLKKVYPAAAAFFYYSGQWPPDLSYVFENSIVLETRSDFFYRDNYKNEVDIVVPLDAPAAGKRPRLVPVEVKFSDAVKPKALKPIQLFMNRNKVNTGIIITKNTGKEMTNDDLRILFIPGWQFALEKEKIFQASGGQEVKKEDEKLRR
jgi:predicted AAA+ superfamily ATPase